MHSSAMRRVAIAGVSAAIAAIGVASPAYAGSFIQGHTGDADYWASADFIPTITNVTVGAYACAGGGATSFYLDFKKTSNAKVLWSSPHEPANTRWYHFGITTPYPRQAHYLKIWGQVWDTNANPDRWEWAPAPCYGVSASWG
jgi:hypothetical protein